MLGRKKFEPKLFYELSLERLVPADNFYRRILGLIDFNFLYNDCSKLYGNTGNPSIDPVVFFKMLLYGYLENIISDRELVRRMSDSLSGRLFIGYDIDEELPWHSTLSRTRQKLPCEVFEKIFELILDKCVESGLVSGNHQSIDSTLVKANASMESLERRRPELSLSEYVEKTRKLNVLSEREEYKEKDVSIDTESLSDIGEAEVVSSTELKKKEGLKAGKNKKLLRYSNKDYYSKSDGDSRIARKPGKLRDLYYTTHYSSDSKRNIITDVFTIYSDVVDSELLLDIVDRVSVRLEARGLKLKSSSADKNYCSGKNLLGLESRGIEGFIPYHRRGNPTGCYSSDKFVYDEESDIYICPLKKELNYSYTRKGEARIYRASKEDCMGCKLKDRCTRSENRQVRRSIYKEAYDRLSIRLASSAGRMASVLRKTGPEPLFAEAKGYHGMRKYMTRGRLKAQKNSLLIATVQNLKRLMNNWRGGLKQCNVKDIVSSMSYTFINLLHHFYRICLVLIRKFEYNF